MRARAKLRKEGGLPGGNHLAEALKDKDTLVKKRRGTCTKVGAKVAKLSKGAAQLKLEAGGAP